MMKFILLLFSALSSGIVRAEVPMEPNVETFNYTHQGDNLQGFYAKPEGEGPFPAVVILP
jgi:hypothetical protein